MSVISKTVRNESGSTLTVGGVTLLNGESYTLPKTQYTEWSINPNLESLIQSGDLVVSNSEGDLGVELGKLHMTSGIVFNHEDIFLPPAIGINAPELVSIDGASVGFCMEIGNVIYGQTKVDGLVGDIFELQVHYTIDNSILDRHIEFEVSYFTTNGVSDYKNINTGSSTVTLGPVEVEDSPWVVRQAVVNLPTSAFTADETYLFFGIKRVTPSGGLTSPANDPVVLRYCKRYYRVDN